MTKLKPWPSDAVMIVAPSPALAVRSMMESVNPGECRDCGAAIVYCGFTFRRVELLSRGRPIKFFCIACCKNYDALSCDVIEDHSEGKR